MTKNISGNVTPNNQPTQNSPGLMNEGPIEGLAGGLEGLGNGISEFLSNLFMNAFGGDGGVASGQKPGFRWDALDGWVADGSAPQQGGGQLLHPAMPNQQKIPVAPIHGAHMPTNLLPGATGPQSFTDKRFDLPPVSADAGPFGNDPFSPSPGTFSK
jgi:hypothetical protein